MATVFDKLNQVYKDYLDADQSYTAVSSGMVVLVSGPRGFTVNRFLLFAGHGVRSESGQRRPEAPGQNSGGHRSVGHVHPRPVDVH